MPSQRENSPPCSFAVWGGMLQQCGSVFVVSCIVLPVALLPLGVVASRCCAASSCRPSPSLCRPSQSLCRLSPSLCRVVVTPVVVPPCCPLPSSCRLSPSSCHIIVPPVAAIVPHRRAAHRPAAPCRCPATRCCRRAPVAAACRRSPLSGRLLSCRERERERKRERERERERAHELKPPPPAKEGENSDAL